MAVTMPELRRNIATGEWVVLAAERAKRPEEFSRRAAAPDLPARMGNCPFCPGNESMTPPTLAQTVGENGWRVRVVNNAFGAFSATGDLSPRGNEYLRSMDAVGYHEVIIQTPAHDIPEPLLSPEQMRKIVLMYRDRHRFMECDPRVEIVIPFKNHGLMAGTSLVHPHAQIAGVPIVPAHLIHRIEEPLHYYREQRSCVFCVMLAEELKGGERVVEENDAFVAFIPYAAATPFEAWIMPREHRASFGAIDDGELHLFAALLGSVLRRLYCGLQNPDYNYMIRSAPREHRDAPFLHWYAKIIPRLTNVAGFEMGTGMFINTARPEESAAFLRNVKGLAAD